MGNRAGLTPALGTEKASRYVGGLCFFNRFCSATYKECFKGYTSTLTMLYIKNLFDKYR